MKVTVVFLFFYPCKWRNYTQTYSMLLLAFLHCARRQAAFVFVCFLTYCVCKHAWYSRFQLTTCCLGVLNLRLVGNCSFIYVHYFYWKVSSKVTRTDYEKIGRSLYVCSWKLSYLPMLLYWVTVNQRKKNTRCFWFGLFSSNYRVKFIQGCN